MATAEKEAKAERIEVRLTPHAKALLIAAAQARHSTVSEFLLTHGIAAAERAVAVPRVFYASEEGWAAIQAMLNETENAEDANRIALMIKQKSAKIRPA